jgi:stage II sporulation protein D
MPQRSRRRELPVLLGVVLVVALLGATPLPGPGPGARAAAAMGGSPPAAWRFDGGGYGHGIGMSQYGAYGMGLRGVRAGAILGFYYRGTRVRRVALPRLVRVGLLQARLDPSTGRRLGRVLVRGRPVPGVRSSTGAFTAVGVDGRGRRTARRLAGGVTYSVRSQAGGTSIFAGGASISRGAGRVFGPTRAGSGVSLRFQAGVRVPALLALPQAGRTLRWGRLDIGLVRQGTAIRPRAVAVMSFNAYLRGLAEVPSSWPAETLKAQAIAARSYALATMRAGGQHRGRRSWHGCDCGVYADTRDQQYAGWAKERGRGGARWVAAVRVTDRLVLTWRSRVVQAFYSSSSGGHTASTTSWGGPSLSYFPARRDPDDRARGRNPNHRWRVTRSAATVSAALGRYGVGRVVGLRVRSADVSGRVRAVEVRGTSRTVVVPGGSFRSLLRLRSTKFAIRAG